MSNHPSKTDTPAVARPGFAIRATGWVVLVLAVVGLLIWPLVQGRFYGFGQALLYCLLLAAGGWWMHWTHRVLRVAGDRIRIESPVHRRSLKIEGLRLEVREGWWTRIVVAPPFGLPASFLRPLWAPDPASILEEILPPEAVHHDASPTLGGPGPQE
jgi:hypothetical protein